MGRNTFVAVENSIQKVETFRTSSSVQPRQKKRKRKSTH